MTSNVVRSVYGSALQSSQFAGLPFNMLPFTTLNEKFGIQAGVAPQAGDLPVVNYFCIGKGGHKLQTGTDGTELINPVPHVSTDAALYDHIPFVLRPVASDLTALQQASYGLRKIITVNGAQYVAYYLKRLVTSSAVVSINLQTINDGVTTTTQFVPTAANLSPVAPVLDNTGSNVLTSEYAVCQALLPMSFTADECTELLNACTILYGSPSYAIISEIGLCSGQDKVITLAGGASFNEVIAVQIAAFISAFHAIQYTATGISGNYNLGTNEPLLVLGS